MTQHIVIEHNNVGDPTIVAIANPDEALLAYRRRLEALAVEHCGLSNVVAQTLGTEALEQILDEWRGSQSSNLTALFLLWPERPADDEEWTALSLTNAQDRALVEVGPLTAHVVRTDEGVAVDVWGDEQDDGPLASTWATFNDATPPAAAGD